jgi:sugar phosphate isomerase/epimerase
MRIGIMARTFERTTLDESLAATAAAGIPDVLVHLQPGADAVAVRASLDRHGLVAAGLDATFNMTHPDPAERARGLAWLDGIAALAAPLGNPILGICTGTRDTTSMWRRHPDNQTPAAWHDMIASMQVAVETAERHGVTLAFEPEVGNVIDSAARARALLHEIGSPRLKVVIDCANIFHAGELPRMADMIDEAFDLLGPDIVMAHAKDLDHDGAAGHLAVGHGLLDYDRYIANLRRINFTGTILMHGLTEAQVPGCVAFLRGKLAG